MAVARSYRLYCSVYGCLNSSVSKPEITFFKLPTQPARLSEWLRLMCRDDLTNKSNITGYRICEKHFNVQDILPTSNRKVLKKNALPSLNLPDLQSTVQEGSRKEDKQTQTENIVNEIHAQTTTSLSCNTPRKIKLKTELFECRKKLHETENKTQKAELHDVKMERVMLNITEDNNEENDSKITEEEESTDILKQETEIDLFESHEDNIDANKEEPYNNENDEDFLKNDKKRTRKISGNAKRSKSDDDETNQSSRGFIKSKQSRAQRENCYDTFGKYIAELLRSLPPQRALELQPKIVSLIVSAGLEYHEARVSQSDEGID